MATENSVIMPSFVYLNGEFVESDKAFISVFDQGFLYGDGIYESLRSIGNRLNHFSDHFKRLNLSGRELNYNLQFSEAELAEILLNLREMNQLNHAYFRITISRGNGTVGFGKSVSSKLTVLIIAKEFNEFPENNYINGISISVAETRRNAPEAINPKIKSISNLNSLLGKLEAKQKGVSEVLMLNNKDHICEGSASNVFWIKDKWVFTPDTSTGLLEGVTRKEIMLLCEEELDLRVVTGEYKLQDIKFADEVFLTSTSLEIMPVVKINEFQIRDGNVGSYSTELRKVLHRKMGV